MPNAPASSAGNGRRGDYARSEDTRRRIVAAALAEAGESGFHKTSVARIAARAGMAVGVLNYHFGSRDELLAGLMATLTEDLNTRMGSVAPADGDFFNQERVALRVYLEFLHANPAYLRLLAEVRSLSAQLYQDAMAGWVKQFVARVHAGIEAGELRPLDDSSVQVLGYLLLGSYLFLDCLLGSPTYPGDAAVVDTQIDMLRRSLGATT